MDDEYFKIIYKKYFNVLCIYSLRFVLKGEVAEDIVQEVFLDCWDKRKTLDATVSLKSYLYTLTRTKSIDFLRKSENKNIQFSAMETHLEQLLFEALSFEENIDVKEIGRIIEDTVNQLPSRCKEVFLLSREEGLKNREIAVALDISVKSVEKHMTKALKDIRQALEEKGHLTIFIIVFLFISHKG